MEIKKETTMEGKTDIAPVFTEYKMIMTGDGFVDCLHGLRTVLKRYPNESFQIAVVQAFALSIGLAIKTKKEND